MKKVLAILLTVALVSFAVPSFADLPQDLDASLTIAQPSGFDGIVWNNVDTCCAEQSMIDLSIERVNLSWEPVFNNQLDVNINIDESFDASGDSTATSTATSDADADANANATGDSDADATATTSGDESESFEIAGAGALSGTGAVAGAGALAGAGSKAESDSDVDVDASFDADTDVDIDIDWFPTYGIAGELELENVVVLGMRQAGGQDSCVGMAGSMVGDADLDLEANNVFMQEQVQRPVFDEGVLVGASGVQQSASQSYTKLTINTAGSAPVVDGSITYHEGLSF